MGSFTLSRDGRLINDEDAEDENGSERVFTYTYS